MSLEVMLAMELARERQENHFDLAERRRSAHRPRLAWWRARREGRRKVEHRELSQPAGTLATCVQAGAERAALGSVR